MLALALTLLAQSPVVAQPTFAGRVVAESDGKPLGNALVSPPPEWESALPLQTDDQGRFVFTLESEKPARRPGGPRHLHGGEMRVTRPGFAPTTVDTMSRAAWAREIPMRATATLSGIVHGALAGEDVSVFARTEDLSWPPLTGMAWILTPIRAPIDAQGRFQLVDVPAHVPLALRLGAGTYDGGIVLDGELVLAAGESRACEYGRPADPVPAKSNTSGQAKWQRIHAVAVDAEQRARGLAWLELIPEGRYESHARIGGGRWHVHGNRACSCLESVPGSPVLVARDPDGFIGLLQIEVSPESAGTRHRVTLAPGGLLRLHLAGSAKNARVTLSSNGLDFAIRDVLGDTVWYELAPSGPVQIRVLVDGTKGLQQTVDAVAETTIRVELLTD